MQKLRGCEEMGLAPSQSGEDVGKSAVAKVPVPIFSQPLAVILLAVAVLAASPLRAATLPQTHPYQKALRDYLATLSEQDLSVELRPLVWVPGHFAADEVKARYWMLAMEGPAEFPKSEAIRMAAKHFTLAAIEAGDAVNMRPGRGALTDPVDVAWWAQWDYPGNPYFGVKAVKLRALVIAAVDMMMLDESHGQGQGARSDYLGGSMIRLGYTYWVVKDALPPAAREAYEAGLIRMFEKLEQWTPHGSGGSDMEFFQLVGMWYAAHALGGDYPARALKRAHAVIDHVTSRTGYEKHGNAFDVSYQGISLRFLAWAALLYNDPKIDLALHKMLVLKSYLSLPEPTGGLLGPTHFSTGTFMDAPRDQWAWVSRDAAMAMIDDQSLYTIWARVGVPDIDTIARQVQRVIQAVDVASPIDRGPQPWAEDHWTRGINYAFDRYRPGFYERLVKLAEEDSPLTRPPFGRAANFLLDLNDGGELLAAKFDGYGVVIHTGAIASQWANGVSGKSGGSLSAFWTPRRGAAILGLTRATQSDTPDQWTDENQRGPYTWGVHAITGRGASGHYFSSARIRPVESEYKIEGHDRAIVTVVGDLGTNQWSDPQNQIRGSAMYRRTFRVEPEGLTVNSSLALDADAGVRELWEMIPAFLGDASLHRNADPAEVAFRVQEQWIKADETTVLADRVRLRRFDAHVDITFSRLRRVKMSPPMPDRSHGHGAVRNIMIDLLEGGGPPAVEYQITPGP
jgi:hypothetical protein